MIAQDEAPAPLRPRAVTVAVFAAGTVVLAAALVGLGGLTVAGAAALARRTDWQRWGDVGQAFGVLNTLLSGMAFAALVLTLWIQHRELTFQRAELRLQRTAAERSSAELRRNADAGMRMLHFELLKMSITDPALAEIWPEWAPGDQPRRRRQLMYANLVFQHAALSMLMAESTDEQIRDSMRYLFGNGIMREYWSSGVNARLQTHVPGTDSWRIARIVDDVCAEYPPADGEGGQQS